MKRAPRSRQRHDLYAKYHDYDSEISDLLGECGIKDVTSSGITSLLVTHEMQFAKNISNRIVFMDGGVVAADGSPAEIFDKPSNPRLAQFLKTDHTLQLQ